MIGFTFGFSSILILLVAVLIASSIRIFREYERGVVFMLGRFWKVKGPGLVLIVPIVQQAVRMDLRTVVFDVPPQDVITRDNVSVKVNAVVYFRVVDPEKAVIQVARYSRRPASYRRLRCARCSASTNSTICWRRASN